MILISFAFSHKLIPHDVSPLNSQNKLNQLWTVQWKNYSGVARVGYSVI